MALVTTGVLSAHEERNFILEVRMWLCPCPRDAAVDQNSVKLLSELHLYPAVRVVSGSLYL